MRIFRIVKDANMYSIIIFGIIIYKETVGYGDNGIDKYICDLYLHCFITINRNYVMIDDIEVKIKIIQIFGIQVYKKTIDGVYISYFILNYKVGAVDKRIKFVKRYSKYFDEKYDSVFILNAHSGEIYVALCYILTNLLKEEGRITPLLVATSSSHRDLITAFHPDIPYVYIPKIELDIDDKQFVIDGRCYYTLFTGQYFVNFARRLSENEVISSYDMMLKEFNLNKYFVERKDPVVPDSIIDSMIKKVKQVNLNVSNFIFITPEALTCKSYEDDFWSEIATILHTRGFDIFFNTMRPNNFQFKQCDLTYLEAFALAKCSKCIISLRSGFTEILTHTNVPIHVIYTDFGISLYAINAEQSMVGYSLKKPHIVNREKIYEYSANELSANTIMKKILDEVY